MRTSLKASVCCRNCLWQCCRIAPIQIVRLGYFGVVRPLVPPPAARLCSKAHPALVRPKPRFKSLFQTVMTTHLQQYTDRGMLLERGSHNAPHAAFSVVHVLKLEITSTYRMCGHACRSSLTSCISSSNRYYSIIRDTRDLCIHRSHKLGAHLVCTLDVWSSEHLRFKSLGQRSFQSLTPCCTCRTYVATSLNIIFMSCTW